MLSALKELKHSLLMSHVMNTHGPLGARADLRTIVTNEDYRDNIFVLHSGNRSSPGTVSYNEKTFTSSKDTWSKIQMSIFTNLDKSFLASDTELGKSHTLILHFETELQRGCKINTTVVKPFRTNRLHN